MSVEGKSRAELMAIVRADNARYDKLGELWSSLSSNEQQTLLDTARAMVGDLDPEEDEV